MNGKELGKEGNAVREKSSIMLKGKIANHNQGDDKRIKMHPARMATGLTMIVNPDQYTHQ